MNVVGYKVDTMLSVVYLYKLSPFEKLNYFIYQNYLNLICFMPYICICYFVITGYNSIVPYITGVNKDLFNKPPNECYYLYVCQRIDCYICETFFPFS